MRLEWNDLRVNPEILPTFNQDVMIQLRRKDTGLKRMEFCYFCSTFKEWCFTTTDERIFNMDSIYAYDPNLWDVIGWAEIEEMED